MSTHLAKRADNVCEWGKPLAQQTKCAVAIVCMKCGNCSQDSPGAIKYWEGTKAAVVVIVLEEGLFFWQPTRSLTCLLTSCGAQVQTAHGEKVGGPQGFTQKTLHRTRAEDQVPVPGNQGGGSADCSPSPGFKNCFLLCLEGVHSSPSSWRRGAVAAEIMNASATRWRRNNERKVNSHWADSLIHVSILGTCGCYGR